jgi:hypothetical protein
MVTRAGQREQACARKQPHDFDDFVLAADEAAKL